MIEEVAKVSADQGLAIALVIFLVIFQTGLLWERLRANAKERKEQDQAHAEERKEWAAERKEWQNGIHVLTAEAVKQTVIMQSFSELMYLLRGQDSRPQINETTPQKETTP